MWKTRIEQANDERQKPQHAWERVHAYRRLQSSGNLEERVTATNDYNEFDRSTAVFRVAQANVFSRLPDVVN